MAFSWLQMIYVGEDFFGYRKLNFKPFSGSNAVGEFKHENIMGFL
jgi:hypothetical protein